MTTPSGILPAKVLQPGRYILSRHGRLHPFGMRKIIQHVAIVNVRAKPAPSPVDKVRAECAAEAADRESRFREARRLTSAHPLPPEPSERDKPLRSLARRRADLAPTPEPTEDDDSMADLRADLARVQARRGERTEIVSRPGAMKVDGAALAAAFARKKRVAPAPRPAPTKRALSGEGCEFCGVPGRRGCDHFLPYEGG